MGFNDLNFDNDYKEDMAPTMIRQRYKLQLIATTNNELDAFSKYRALWGKKYNKAVRDVFNDYFKGVRKINKKNPIYAEMPKLVPVGKDTGQIKEVYDGENVKDVKDVTVFDSLNSQPSVNVIENDTTISIEDKKPF